MASARSAGDTKGYGAVCWLIMRADAAADGRRTSCVLPPSRPLFLLTDRPLDLYGSSGRASLCFDLGLAARRFAARLTSQSLARSQKSAGPSQSLFHTDLLRESFLSML